MLQKIAREAEEAKANPNWVKGGFEFRIISVL